MITAPAQGQLSGTALPAQLLLWQALQQLQSFDPNKQPCTVLVDELRIEKIRTQQERTRRQDFEEEAYMEMAKIKNENKLSKINTDGLMLELQVKKSKLEDLEKHLTGERTAKVKLEVEKETCKLKLQQEQDLNALLGQELGSEKEKSIQESELIKDLEEEITKLRNQVLENNTSSVNVQRELENEKKNVQQLKEVLKNERLEKTSAEHEHVKQMLDLKNQLSVLMALQNQTGNPNRFCDVIQAKLNEEKDKMSELKDKLNNISNIVFKLNVELSYERKYAEELNNKLLKEFNNSNTLREVIESKINEISDLESDMELLNREFSEKKLQNIELEKKLEAREFDINTEANKVKKLEDDIEIKDKKIKELEKNLVIANNKNNEVHEQNQSLEKKLRDTTKNLLAEQNLVDTLTLKVATAVKNITDLEKKLRLEREINEEEKDRRTLAENELKTVKHLYINCGESEGFSPLHRASFVCDFSEAQSFMRRGYSASEATKGNSTWKTPVHLAVQAGCIDLLHVFVLNKTLINVWDENGATPLHEAAHYPNLNIVRVLIDNGASINAWDKFGKTPLDYAGINTNSEVMKLLIDRGAILGSARKFGPTTEAVQKATTDDLDYNYYY